MAHFTETRTARKRHVCTLCERPIEPGERYQRFAATPGDEVWSGERWTHLTAHEPYGACLEVAAS